MADNAAAGISILPDISFIPGKHCKDVILSTTQGIAKFASKVHIPPPLFSSHSFRAAVMMTPSFTGNDVSAASTRSRGEEGSTERDGLEP